MFYPTERRTAPAENTQREMNDGRRGLNHSTLFSVTNSTASNDGHVPRRWITSTICKCGHASPFTGCCLRVVSFGSQSARARSVSHFTARRVIDGRGEVAIQVWRPSETYPMTRSSDHDLLVGPSHNRRCQASQAYALGWRLSRLPSGGAASGRSPRPGAYLALLAAMYAMPWHLPCTGSPAIPAFTICIIWRRVFPTTFSRPAGMPARACCRRATPYRSGRPSAPIVSRCGMRNGSALWDFARSAPGTPERSDLVYHHQGSAYC